ncbi:MAG: hypothetical protein A2X82_05865 [Geobacteraceae bacterium GWC2_55_20]|nr:MAG: hypothetical protein A2X82_05865 [Geobacteraceae bacterium GWC2_55_20]OGU22238.1 MAG: hypothetical protein A2X85_00860 [Geobacteraceae bacterium GWF2_54_21]HCE66588.1 hypothetical protein [Geobacter sp.]
MKKFEDIQADITKYNQERIVNTVRRPLISIAMTVFNAARFLSKTLESLLAQDYEDFELVISDNASEDGSSEICRMFAERDSRIKYYRNITNMGPVRNSYKAIDLCTGDFIMPAADHDMYHTSFISRLFELLQQDESVVLAYPRSIYIDENDQTIELLPDVIDTRGLDACQRFCKNIWEFGWMNMVYGLYRSAALRTIWHTQPTIGPDHVMIAKLCFLGSIALIDEPLFFRRRNRPDEDTQECTKRQIASFVNPNYESIIPWTRMAYEHLKVITESELVEKEKELLYEEVRKCFRARFGDLMRNEVMQLITECPIILSNEQLFPNTFDFRKSEIARVARICRFFYPEIAELDTLAAGNVCSTVDAKSSRPIKIDTPVQFATQMESVSVVIPTYNRANLLPRAVMSVLNQTYPIHEIIVVDDGSFDDTETVVLQFQKKYPNIKYKRILNSGAQAARNEGIRQATGEWIAFLDSDDEFLEFKIEKQLELGLSKKVPVVHCECYIVRGDQNPVLFGTPPLSGNIYQDILRSPSITFPSLLVKKSALESIELLDELVPSFQEWDTIIRLAKDHEFGYVSEPLYVYHCHDGETISKDMKRHVRGYVYIVEKHAIDMFQNAGIEALAKHYETIIKQSLEYGLPALLQLYTLKLNALDLQKSLPRLLCFKPFTTIEINSDGNCTFCCYSSKIIGNINDTNLETLFNSVAVQDSRRKFYQNDYSECDKSRCNIFASDDMKYFTNIPDDDLQFRNDINICIANRNTVIEKGPSRIVDSSHGLCNVQCKFCWPFKRHTQQNFNNKTYRMLINNKSNINEIHLAGGEPFYNPLIDELILELIDKEINLGVTSNLTYLMDSTKKLLSRVHIINLNASINAASKNIYDQLVQGGDWENVCENLVFFKTLRETRPDFRFGISMVVNRMNYHEIADFIDFGFNRFSVDYVSFHPPDEGHMPESLKLTAPDAIDILKILEMPIFTKFGTKINFWGLKSYVMKIRRDYADANQILPKSIQISISDACNFKCTSCWIHGPNVAADDNNLEASLYRNSKPQIMDINVYEHLIADIKNNPVPVAISFCGKGEPTLHPQFMGMVKFAYKNGLFSNITTNGSGLTIDMLKALREMKVTLNISLNAYNQASHQSFCNIHKDYFTPIIEMLRHFSKSEFSGFISLSFVVGAHNISSINKMAELSAEILPPDSSISFYPEWTHKGNPENRVSTGQIGQLLGELSDIIAILSEANISHNLNILPYVLYGLSVSNETDEPTRDYYMKNPCSTVDNFMVVLADGRVVPCCRSAYVYGNINDRSILDIWSEPQSIEFRCQAKNICNTKKEAPNSHCFSCDHVMGNEYFIDRYRSDIDALISARRNQSRN